MSLTEGIGQLTARVDALINTFETKKAGIDAAVQSALRAAVSNYVRYYLDQVNGDDKAEGTISAPIKSIREAIRRISSGWILEIGFLGDYHMEAERYNMPRGSFITLFGQGGNGLNPATWPKLVMTMLPVESVEDQYRVSGFHADRQGVAGLCFNHMKIVFPKQLDNTTHYASAHNAFLSTNSSYGPPHLFMDLSFCDIQRPETNAAGYLIGAGGRCVSLSLRNTTYPEERMAGRWISGIVANTAVKDASTVLSNLKTL